MGVRKVFRKLKILNVGSYFVFSDFPLFSLPFPFFQCYFSFQIFPSVFFFLSKGNLTSNTQEMANSSPLDQLYKITLLLWICRLVLVVVILYISTRWRECVMDQHLQYNIKSLSSFTPLLWVLSLWDQIILIYSAVT